VRAPTRLTKPRYRKPGADRFEDVTWDFALDRIAKLFKEDRDKNFIATNKDGVTVNRWVSTGFLAASASSNETALLTYKVVRGLGAVAFDNQARV
jgi:formate dehydrogenase major subunit